MKKIVFLKTTIVKYVCKCVLLFLCIFCMFFLFLTVGFMCFLVYVNGRNANYCMASGFKFCLIKMTTQTSLCVIYVYASNHAPNPCPLITLSLLVSSKCSIYLKTKYIILGIVIHTCHAYSQEADLGLEAKPSAIAVPCLQANNK